jgi:hypothetical protein
MVPDRDCTPRPSDPVSQLREFRIAERRLLPNAWAAVQPALRNTRAAHQWSSTGNARKAAGSASFQQPVSV